MARISLAAIISHIDRSAHIFQSPMSTQSEQKRKKHPLSEHFFALPLHQPSKYISYCEVPIAFPLANYLQAGRQADRCSVTLTSGPAIQKADDVFAKVALESIRPKWKACHKTGLMPSTLAVRFAENHLKPQKALTLGIPRAYRQKCYSQMH